MTRSLRILVLTSQRANAWLLRGDPRETVSGRCHREAQSGCLKWQRRERIINALFRDDQHCRESHHLDLIDKGLNP
jgi:hypothetical protein